MVKLEITSNGAIAGRDTTLIIDGVDVSQHCTALTLDIKVGEPAKATVTLLVDEISASLGEVEVTGFSEEFRRYANG
jgi:hypothetical protein